MITHPPTVEISPQPTQYNVLNTDRLQNQWLTGSPVICRTGSHTELAFLSCDKCDKQVNLNAGYPFLDDFLCDLCMARLVASTGGAYAR